MAVFSQTKNMLFSTILIISIGYSAEYMQDQCCHLKADWPPIAVINGLYHEWLVPWSEPYNYFLPRHSRKIIFRFFDCHTFFAAMTRIPEEEHFCIFTWWRWWRWRNMKESLTSENEAPKWTAFAFLWNFLILSFLTL